ncbi:MAG: hypothetical protein AAF802_08995, partial [Planctomycetota bacterium]
MEQIETPVEKSIGDLTTIEDAFRTESVVEPATGEDDPKIELSGLWHSLRRRWPAAVLLGFCLGPILGYAVFLASQPPNGAVAYLRVAAVDAPLAFQTADRSGGGRNSFDLYKNTQRQLIRTPYVLNKALADEKVRGLAELEGQQDPLEWIKEGLDIEFPGRGEVMSITFVAEQSATSIAVVEAILKAYMNEAVLDEEKERQTRLTNLEEVYADTDSKVRKRRAEIRKLADTLGTSDSESLSVAQQLSIQRYGQIQSQLGTVKFEWLRGKGELEALRIQLAKLEGVRDQLQDAMDDALSEGSSEIGGLQELTSVLEEASGSEILNSLRQGSSLNDSGEALAWELTEIEKTAVLSNDRIYQQLYVEARGLRDEIDLYRTRYGEGMLEHKRTRLERLNHELKKRGTEALKIAEDEKRKKLAVNKVDTYADLPSELRRVAVKINELDEQIVDLRNQAFQQEINNGILEQQVIRIEDDLAALAKETKELGRSSVDVEMMRAEIASLGDVLNRLSSEIERTKIELKGTSRVRVLAKPAKLGKQDTKKTMLTAAVAGLAGVCFPLFALVGVDLREKLVNDPKTITRQMSVPVLGSVPRETKLHQVFQDERIKEGAFGNSVSSIVAILVNRAKFCDFNTIMVSSAMPGEGKSTLSHSLWRGLSEANYEVVLVDFDLRHPALHHDLGVEIGAGLSDILAEEASIDDCLKQHTSTRSYVTAGSAYRINLAAAAQDMLPQLFNELRSR